MKKTLLITFLLIQLNLDAQENTKWNIGIEYSFDNLSLANGQNNDYLVTQGKIDGYGITFDKNNNSFGLKSQFFFNERISWSSGFLYSNKDFTGTYNCATCDFGFRPSGIIKQRFLIVPVSIDYSFLKGNIKPIIKAGFKNNVEIDNDLKEQSKGYFLEAFLGVSINYDIFQSWNLGVGYNYQAALTDLYKTDKYNLRTNSLYLQIIYHVK